MWELSALTSNSDFARRALPGNYLGVGGEEGVLKERKKQDFRVMAVGDPGCLRVCASGQGSWRNSVKWLVSFPLKPLSLSSNTQKTGPKYVVSYFVLKLLFFFFS